MELSPATTEVYLRRAFDRILEVVDRMGDDHVNVVPDLVGANSVAALVVHCCELTEFWLGHAALGHPTSRDRDAEFTATATPAELHHRVDAAMATAPGHLADLDGGLGNDESGIRPFLPEDDRSDASVVLHVLEELYQHLGHMELTADLVLAGAGG